MWELSRFRRYLRFLGAIAFIAMLTSGPVNAKVLEEDDDSYLQQGVFFSLDFGPYLFLAKPATLSTPDVGEAGLFGMSGGVQMGYALSPQFSLQFIFFSYHVRGNAQIGGGSSSYLINLGITFAFLRFLRTFLYVKLGAGVMLTSPPFIYKSIGFAALGGLGVRVHSRMKHFSFALETLTTIRFPLGGEGEFSMGLGLLPSVIYTF